MTGEHRRGKGTDEVDDTGKRVTVSATATGGHGVADVTLAINDNDVRGVKVSQSRS